MNTEHVPAGGSRSRWLARIIVATLAWGLLLTFAWLMWPTSLGGKTTMITVTGQSMEPLYHGGDIVIARSGKPRVGDVVIYNPEGYGDAKVIHRIIGGDGVNGWQLRGDNNDFVDPFDPADDRVLGIAVLHLPKAGLGVAWLAKPWVWGALLILAAVMVLWPGRDDEEDDEDDPDAGREGEEGAADPDGDAPLTPAEQAVLAMIVGVQRVAGGIHARGPRAVWGTGAAAFVVALTVAAVATVVNPAQAAHLNLNATGATTHSEMYCWPGTVNLTSEPAGTASAGSYTQVRVLNVPAACAGRVATVRVYNASGTLLTSGTATLAAGSNVVTLAGSYLASAAARVVVAPGAPRVAPFSAPPPPAGLTCQSYNTDGTPNAAPCTISVASHGTYVANGYRVTNFQFSAVTTAPIWQITVDLSTTNLGFTGMSPVRFVGMYQNVASAPGYSCTSLPVFVGREANPSWNSTNGELVFSDNPNFTAGTTLCDV